MSPAMMLWCLFMFESQGAKRKSLWGGRRRASRRSPWMLCRISSAWAEMGCHPDTGLGKKQNAKPLSARTAKTKTKFGAKVAAAFSSAAQ
eukprot:scaffold1400_cov113-Isochrysis_galbana.AAC.3